MGARNTYNLRHVQDNNGGFETDTHTSNETTDNDNSESISKTSEHLNDYSDHVDGASENNSPFTAHAVSNITSGDSTKECTGREDRDDERLISGR